MATRRPESPRSYLKPVLITMAALGLSIGVLASLPGASARQPPAATTTTTSQPSGNSSTTTTSSTATAASATKVVVLAAAGSTSASSVRQKLTAAHDDVIDHAAIPSSWVTTLRSPIVRYPEGLYDQAVAVAKSLGLTSDIVSAEPTGTSDGADVVEVFVPTS